MPKKRNPWDRMPEESDKAFRAFSLYKKAPNMTQEDVGKYLGQSRKSLEGWAVKFKWRERRKAWLDHLQETDDAEYEKRRLKRIRQTEEADFGTGQALTRIAAQKLLKAEAQLKLGKKKGKPYKITDKDGNEIVVLPITEYVVPDLKALTYALTVGSDLKRRGTKNPVVTKIEQSGKVEVVHNLPDWLKRD